MLQASRGGPDPPALGRARAPLAVKGAAAILVLLAAVEVFLGSLFVTNQDQIAGAITAAMPRASPETLADRIFATTAEGVLVHAMALIVYLAAAIALRVRGRQIRIFATALAAVATLTDTLILGQMPSVLPDQALLAYATLGGSTVLRAGLTMLLWMPASARRWYGSEADTA